MRRINRCLNKQLIDLCQHALQLDDLSMKLNDYLPESLREKCTIGSFNKGCLSIVTLNPIWATEIRYYLPTLRDKLRKEAGLYQLSSIKLQIIADTYPTPSVTLKKDSRSKLSLSAKEAVQNAGELCSYQPLRDILLRLAGR